MCMHRHSRVQDKLPIFIATKAKGGECPKSSVHKNKGHFKQGGPFIQNIVHLGLSGDHSKFKSIKIPSFPQTPFLHCNLHESHFPRRAKRALGSEENSHRLLLIDSDIAGRIGLKLGGMVEGMCQNVLVKEFFGSVEVDRGQVTGQ